MSWGAWTGTAVLVALAGVQEAAAHAPMARGVTVSPGGAPVVQVPGFGLLVPGSDGHRYACDALAGVQGRGGLAPLLLLADGGLLVGGAAGLQRLDAAGCPDGEVLIGAPIVALAVHPAEARELYAATGGDAPGLHVSDDGGQQWHRVGDLPAGAPTDSLVVGAGSPPAIYMTAGAVLLVSDDGGASMRRSELPDALRLLAVGARVWAVRDDPDTREAVLLRGADAAGPYDEVARVRFFGGFAYDEESGRVWLADEAGGLLRSDDAGERFRRIRDDLAVACLRLHDDSLFACTPGTVDQPAVQVSRDGGESFEPVIAFEQVERMVECSADAAVDDVCAFAWAEWEADVLGSSGLPVIDGADAASPTARVDAAAPAGAEDAGVERDAGNGSAEASDETSAASGCSIAPTRRRAGAANWLGLLALALAARRCPTRRRAA